MYKKLIFIFFLIIIIYYILTLIFSLTFIIKSVTNNSSDELEKYLLTTNLKSNFYKDIYNYNQNYLKKINKNINIKDGSVEFSGELTNSFIKKIFKKVAQNISIDFSDPTTLLYFYFNSKELEKYLSKSFENFGNYNFKKYIFEKNTEQIEGDTIIENNNSENKNKKSNNIAKVNTGIYKLFKKIKSTNYFFFSSPIHFKIDTPHQDLNFIVIFKFNGFLWKLHKIKIPYDELVDLNLLTFN